MCPTLFHYERRYPIYLCNEHGDGVLEVVQLCLHRGNGCHGKLHEHNLRISSKFLYQGYRRSQRHMHRKYEHIQLVLLLRLLRLLLVHQ